MNIVHQIFPSSRLEIWLAIVIKLRFLFIRIYYPIFPRLMCPFSTLVWRVFYKDRRLGLICLFMGPMVTSVWVLLPSVIIRTKHQTYPFINFLLVPTITLLQTLKSLKNKSTKIFLSCQIMWRYCPGRLMQMSVPTTWTLGVAALRGWA